MSPRHAPLGPTILNIMTDPNLFGPVFGGASWTFWRVLLKAIFALPMTPHERAIYIEHTGREVSPSSFVREAWLIVGRRGGKSLIAALVAVYLAFFRTYDGVLAPGEVGTLAVIAADRRQARTVRRYIEGLINAVPFLAAMVVKTTQDAIELNNRVVIEIHTSNFRAVRGYTLVGAICDEVAFWRAEDTAANPDVEILNGLRPGLLTTGGPLVCISTPYPRRGTVWLAYRDHFAKDGDPVLVWTGSSQSMNPLLPDADIQAAYAADPAAASAEYGGQFRQDIEVFLPEETLARVVVPERGELPPVFGTRYVGFVDPSGGSQDSFALAIAHRDSTNAAILDCVREARPPFNPENVVADLAEVCRSYQVWKVLGDRYAGEWPRSAFRKHQIGYEVSEKTKSEMYLELLPMLSAGHIELLDHTRLLAQFRGLERRTSRTGKHSVDHGPHGHDDLANAAAGALVACASRSAPFSRAILDGITRLGRPREHVGGALPQAGRIGGQAARLGQVGGQAAHLGRFYNP